METSINTDRRISLRPKTATSLATKPVAPKKAGKNEEGPSMPILIAGREVLGRELNVLKPGLKDVEWVCGSVTAFNEPQVLHQIAYKLPLPTPVKEIDAVNPEEWLCLGKSPFHWAPNEKVWPFANVTYSKRFTPEKEKAIGQRVKVFWTAMARWYQGKVVSYDDATGMHRVKFKDGDTHGYRLSQEAMVWLDIPELSTDSAIRKSSCEEGGPIPIAVIGTNDENKPPAKLEEELKAAVVPPERSKPRREKKEQSSARKITRRQSAEKESARVVKQQAVSNSQTKQKAAASACKSSLKEQVKTPKAADASPEPQSVSATANGSHKAENGNGLQSQQEQKRIPLQAVPQISQTPLPSQSGVKPSQEGSKPAVNGNTSNQAASHSLKREKGVEVKVVCSSSDVLPGSSGLMRSASIPGKRSRTALAGKNGTNEDESAVKHRALSKLSRGPAKIGQKAKPAQRSRQGSRLCKNSADLQFVEHCEAIKGCRVGVWWPKDKCHYKGRVKGYDGCHRTLTIEYDDGITEKTPRLDDCKFLWLLPRARSGGASNRIHAAFQSLGATNATDPVQTPEKRQSVAVEIPVKMEVQAHGTGLHPSRPSLVQDSQASRPPGSIPSQPTLTSLPSLSAASHLLPPRNPNPEPASSVGGSKDNTVPLLVHQQAVLAQPTGPATPAMNGSAQGMSPQMQANAQTLWMLQNPGLIAYQPSVQTAASVNSQRPSIPTQSAPSISPSPSPMVMSPSVQSPAEGTDSVSKPEQEAQYPPGFKPPHGAAAEGWKVSITFRGNGQVFEGRILAYKAKSKKHHVLWEDGEDELIDVDQEDLTWLSDCKKTPGYAAGAPPGVPAPTGQDLVGWKVALYWKREGKFYQGIVESCDEAINQYRIAYNDGDGRFEIMSEVFFKLVLPPNVKMRQGSLSLQTQDSDGSKRGNPGRRPKKKQRAQTSDDSDDEIRIIEPPVERRSLTLRPIPSLDLRLNSQQSIRRLPSGRGSLLVFGDQIPVSPTCTPLSPQHSMGCGLMRMDSKGPPACVKNVRGLRDASGFRVGVKRVRVFLNDAGLSASNPGSKEISPSFADSKPTKLLGAADKEECNNAAKEDEKQEADPSAASLKTILERVEQAKENIRNGMPLEMHDSNRSGSLPFLPSMASFRSSKPLDPLASRQFYDKEGSPRLPESASEPVNVEPARIGRMEQAMDIKIELEDTESLPVLSTPILTFPHEATPPPSPFSGLHHSRTSPSHSPQRLNNLMLSCSPEDQSMSLPHTPSLRFEAAPRAPSRGTSQLGQETMHEGLEHDCRC